jgi:hypothetical protein
MSAAPSTSFAIPFATHLAKRRAQLAGATALLLLSLTAGPGFAQGLQPGEAFATRFSGTAQGPDGLPAIDPQGTVGSILDLRAPGQPPQGQHWLNEPQRAPITAAQTGQVFGVAFDDATPPNIYVTATVAFGLHRTADNAQWMPGMFGRGGPGAIYKLDAANGYQPQLFSVIRLNDRQNSGAALGNITYDRWNKQLLVSDLETGMIHRVSLEGRDLGNYDHGIQGRANFVDAQTGQPMSLAPITFNPASQARIADCEGRFDNTPACWNIAESGRRVWGLGVWRGPNGETRLYYSVASSPDLGGSDWNALPEDEKRNTLWSVRLGPDGAFDITGVRREFVLPDFFSNPTDIARAGYSRPVSDITFPACSGRPIMLVAERGGLRNLGLGQENAFATPHESRTIRFELGPNGTWQAVGRYDVGMYDRSKEGPPYINANCAGGATFGPAYTQDGRAAGEADGFVWISGDKLCSADGPCNPSGALPEQVEQVQQVSTQDGNPSFQLDDTEVHGAQGQPRDMYNALVPETANNQNAQTPPMPIGPQQAYMVDIDINVDASGTPIPEQVAKNDATMIGDISVYQICPVASAAYNPVYPLMIADHGRGVSHYRAGSHARFFSHWRWHSHSRWASHDRRWSRGHDTWWSDGHWRHLSPVHRRHMSPVHWRYMSPTHWRGMSPTHRRHMSPTHNRYLSPTHLRSLSPTHQRPLSPTHQRPLSPPTHQRPLSPPTHVTHVSKQHSTNLSPGTPVPGTVHLRALSKNQPQPKSDLTPVHRRPLSPGAHSLQLSKGKGPTHAAQVSHQRSLSPKIGIKSKQKQTLPKRTSGGMTGGMGGMGSGGMGGMTGGGMGGPVIHKGATKQFTPNRAPQMGGPRIGPQQFRGRGLNLR